MVCYVKVILGSIAFAIFWMLAVFPVVPFLPIGRTAGSLFGAVLMVIFQAISVDDAYDAVDLSILGLLFGTMVISGYLARADALKYLSKLLSWRSKGGKDLICRICLISAVSSALFTNDTTCMVLTGFVLKIAEQNNLPPHPFLLALASGANIGSAATPIGSPQNLVIATESGISFGKFLTAMLPATLLGVIANSLILMFMYWDSLSIPKDEEDPSTDFVAEESVSSYQFSLATTSHESGSLARYEALTSSNEGEIQCVHNGSPDLRNSNASWKRTLWKSSVYLVILGMLVSLVAGLDMSWTAVTAALVLIVLDFKDGTPCLNKVSYSLLTFFCGMFITIEGFDKTGIPETLWNFMEPYARINQAGGVAVLAVVILLLSNLISNVPTVLLLGTRMAVSAALIAPVWEKKAWLILAWVSSVAGNLSLLGSAANLIVCEEAGRNPQLGYTLTFWSHFKFGIPSTLIVTTLGLLLV